MDSSKFIIVETKFENSFELSHSVVLFLINLLPLPLQVFFGTFNFTPGLLFSSKEKCILLISHFCGLWVVLLWIIIKSNAGGRKKRIIIPCWYLGHYNALSLRLNTILLFVGQNRIVCWIFINKIVRVTLLNFSLTDWLNEWIDLFVCDFSTFSSLIYKIN